MQAHLRKFISRKIGTNYIRLIKDEENHKIGEFFDQALTDVRVDKSDKWKFHVNRYIYRQRLAPGQQKKFDLKEKIRREDRAKVNFMCRYALGLKKVGLPLN